MKQHASIRVFIQSAGTLTLIAALATLMSAAPPAGFLQPHDPILRLPMPTVFWIFGLLELAVALVCLFGNGERLKLWFVFGLGWSISAYLVGLVCVAGPRSFTGYWHNLASHFAINPDTVFWTISAVAFYLAIGGFISLQTVRRQPLSVCAYPERRALRAFTLIELLVVIAIIGILASLLLPALSKTKDSSKRIVCLDNTKQIALAWTMYAGDFHDRFPANPATDGGGQDSLTNWVTGWLNFQPNQADDTNTLLLTGAVLGNYVKGNAKIYSCPSDVYPCIEGGVIYRRVRTFSMNGFIEGGTHPESAGAQNMPMYRKYDKLGDVVAPGPSKLWVVLDEHPDSINDGWMGPLYWRTMNTSTGEFSNWDDLPGSLHDGGCNLSFADGHSETHIWKDAATKRPVEQNGGGHHILDPERNDVKWMTERSSALR